MTGSRWAGITLPVDSERLVGSVKHHVRHLVVVTAHADWPAHLEEGQDLAAHLVRAVEGQGEDGRLPIKVTAAAPFGAAPSVAPASVAAQSTPQVADGSDVLVFPDMLRHRAVRAEQAAALVSRYSGIGAASLAAELPAVERLSGCHLIVCVHGARDERCGSTGPPLLSALADEVGERALGDVSLYGGSHVGGHKFAGCLLAFPSGDWYGQLSAASAAEVVGECVVADRILTQHWRGRVGLTAEAQLAASAG